AATSTDVTVTVNGVQPGTIAGSQSVCAGTIPTAFTSSVNSTGTGAITYQWESKVSGGSWTTIDNATSATYSPDVATVETSYRRVAYSTIDNSICTTYSNEIIVTIASDCNFIAVKTVADNGNDGNEINNKAESNENLTYSITIDNNYDRDIVVNISDVIPANTTFVSVQNGGVHSAGTITWDDVTVLKGGSTTVTFVVKVTENLTGIANIVNTAVVSSPGLATQNPNVTIPTNSNPDFTFDKTVADASGDGKAQSGEVLTYTITVNNTGDVDLMNGSILDVIPANTTLVAGSITGGGTQTGNNINWSIDLPFGDSKSVTFQVTVTADLTGVTNIRNIATVGDQDTPPVDIPTENSPSHSSVKTV
ncbi:conserved repeat domain-containing protein, partial [Sphingobacterium nematocida]